MKHMNLENRELIEEMLKERKNFTEISKAIGYHRTTISDEIIKHRIKGKVNNFNVNFINCKFEDTCDNYESTACKCKCEKYIRKECIKTIHSFLLALFCSFRIQYATNNL